MSFTRRKPTHELDHGRLHLGRRGQDPRVASLDCPAQCPQRVMTDAIRITHARTLRKERLGQRRIVGAHVGTPLASAGESRREKIHMHKATIPLIAAFFATVGCGTTFPPPTQSLADAESAERSAAELGAAGQPKAQLHLQLAEEQITQAKAAMKNGDNDRASGLLMRARSDAELAIALTRAQAAQASSQKAVVQSNTQQTTNANQGAAQ
jgi:hypothetical protein